jgi:hypothetical protein
MLALLSVMVLLQLFGISAPAFASDIQTEEPPVLIASPGVLSAQQRFAQANALLGESRYSEALTEYRTIIAESGEHNGPIYLNMGIAATRLDSLGLAKVYFIKAGEFRETERAAREGREFVTDQLGRRGAQLPELTWMAFHNHVYFGTNYAMWLALGILLLNIGVFLFIVAWLRERFKPVNRKAGIALGAAGLLIVMVSVGLSLQSGGYQQGIQIVREASVYQSPDAEAEVVQTAFEGYRFIVNIPESRAYDGWVRVRMVNGAQGWVRDEALYRF